MILPYFPSGNTANIQISNKKWWRATYSADIHSIRGNSIKRSTSSYPLWTFTLYLPTILSLTLVYLNQSSLMVLFWLKKLQFYAVCVCMCVCGFPIHPPAPPWRQCLPSPLHQNHCSKFGLIHLASLPRHRCKKLSVVQTNSPATVWSVSLKSLSFF